MRLAATACARACRSAPRRAKQTACETTTSANLDDYLALSDPHSGIFHRIDTHHPRLTLLNARPFIFAVPGFLDKQTCAALRRKAAASLAPQGFDDAEGGTRTSVGAVARSSEVAGLRDRLASLARVPLTHLQPLKISRYSPGAQFSMHTDAWRGNLFGQEPSPDDWWADLPRLKHGVPGGPISGANRVCTVFIYLSDCDEGGRTVWNWTDYDSAGGLGRRFYDQPGPGHGRTYAEGAGVPCTVSPREGLAVIHFPATTARSGGFTDYNAYHAAEPAVTEKWIAQQFIWSHPLDWRRVLDVENWEPASALSAQVL